MPLPDGMDIVFQEWDGDISHDGNIALMAGDGTRVQTILRSVRYVLPLWSPDKSDISMTMPWDNLGYDNIYGRLVSYAQGERCSSLMLFGRMRWTPDGKIITVDSDDVDGIPEYERIITWDSRKCKIVDILYKEKIKDHLHEPDISRLGSIVFTRISDDGMTINLYESKAIRVVPVAEGFGATWSPDGTRFVFTGPRGVYFANADGTSVRNVIDLTGYYPVTDDAIVWGDWPPIAVWSPDGRFLLYHRIDGKIYDLVKFEIATGKETILYHGGMYPDWK
jgi:Tol biopolymer transport system component